MDQAVSIPTHLEAVTPGWMTRVLHDAGVIQAARVTGVRGEVLANQGIVGQVVRLNLVYDRGEENQVASVIAKFPSGDPGLRKGLQDLYQKEIRFYQSLPPDLGLAVPKPYFAAMEEMSGDNLLLLEDLSTNARPGNNVSGCTLAEANAAVTQMAKFHARWWGEKHQEQFGWLPRKSEYLKGVANDQFSVDFEDWARKIEQVIPGFCFSPEFLRSAHLLSRNYLRIKNFLYNGPATVVHDDFKLDNMIFRGDPLGPELALIDWHLVSSGPGVCDLGYFAGFCLSPEQRKQAEQDLVKRYYAILGENGVRDYDFSRFLLEYRLSALEPLERFVQVRFVLDGASQQVIANFRSLLARLCPFVEDCRVGELLS